MSRLTSEKKDLTLPREEETLIAPGHMYCNPQSILVTHQWKKEGITIVK